MTLNLTDIEKNTGQQEITQPIVEHAWLDLSSAPDEKTKIQRLKLDLVLNGDHKKQLYNSYYCEGLVLHSYNLTWMFNSYKERITIADKKLQKYEEIIRKQSETLEWYSISENTECPNECAGVPKLAIETLAWVKGEMG